MQIKLYNIFILKNFATFLSNYFLFFYIKELLRQRILINVESRVRKLSLSWLASFDFRVSREKRMNSLLSADAQCRYDCPHADASMRSNATMRHAGCSSVLQCSYTDVLRHRHDAAHRIRVEMYSDVTMAIHSHPKHTDILSICQRRN